jgi:hypothetical protein
MPPHPRPHAPSPPCTLQVAGLPTNLHFLQRLSAHPSFMAAQDLDTGFIARHGAQLLAPEPLTPEVAALAAVARHLIKVCGVCLTGQCVCLTRVLTGCGGLDR